MADDDNAAGRLGPAQPASALLVDALGFLRSANACVNGSTAAAYARVMAGTQVLVVDDDPTVSDVVRRYLERAGFAVTLAADGPSALAAAEQRPPDLVVLDLMLPGMSGLDVCRRLRERSDVPVVMLTALGEEVDRVVGFEVGADDYVTKPFSPRELALRVQSVLRRAERPRRAPGDAGRR